MSGILSLVRNTLVSMRNVWCTRVHHRMRVQTPSLLLTQRTLADAETYQPLVGATGERTRLRIAGTTQTLSLALHFSRMTLQKIEHLFSSVSRITLLCTLLVFFWGGQRRFVRQDRVHSPSGTWTTSLYTTADEKGTEAVRLVYTTGRVILL